MNLRLIGFLLLETLVCASGSEFRSFSDGKQLSVVARPVALLGDARLLLENEKGEQFETPLEILSATDHQWFSTWKTEWLAREEMGTRLNQAIGHSVFESSWRLWDEKAGAVAKRLRWRQESQTPHSSSYRRYARANYRFLGARPYSLAAYGDDRGQLARISIVFANKGDSFSAAGSGEDHFNQGENQTTMEAFIDSLRTDHKIISEALSSLLGEGAKQRFGEGQNRRSVTRWDWNGHAFILSEEEREYVGLMIVSVEEADNQGRSDRVSDESMRSRLVENVVRKENGDVFLKNIPMVNQGPKGYCAPATFERAMRYSGVPADMYLLAVAGGTAPGGGTNTARLFEEVRSIVYRKGRRPSDVSLAPLRMRNVAKTIDKGIPIMWRMRSLRLYNQVANARTRQRSGVSDWAAYAEDIAKKAKQNSKEMAEERNNYHLCLIIGYNEATQEVAVSDSWGKRYSIRWVHLEEAAAVTEGDGFVINL